MSKTAGPSTTQVANGAVEGPAVAFQYPPHFRKSARSMSFASSSTGLFFQKDNPVGRLAQSKDLRLLLTHITPKEPLIKRGFERARL